ncbi:MAG: aminoacyl-tRNA hydrolase [Alphaproteobacteria bacterium]
MWLFVGLGNPGSKHEKNRHNIGFMAMDSIASEYPAFSAFKNKFQGEISEGRLGNQKILLLKPQTYMNNSGQSVVKASQFYKIDPDKIIVFHDELDIPASEIRVKQGGGNAGHNGLKSIQSHLGTADFWRVRMGIGRPPHKEASVSNFVLDDFSKVERDWLDRYLELAGDNADLIVKDNPKAYEKIIKEKLKS